MYFKSMEITAFVAEIVILFIFVTVYEIFTSNNLLGANSPTSFYRKCEQSSCWFYFSQQLCLPLDYFVDTLVTADGINKTTQ